MSEKIVEISEDSLMWIDERYNRLREENKRLNNIIKEVREYITYARTPRTIYESGYGKGTCVEICMEHLLDILDKENK